MSQRSTISRRLRFEILRRDQHTCRYCGAKAPDVTLQVDHVVPVALGGSDDPANLVAACTDCNSGKSSIAPDAVIVEDVSDDAARWERARATAAANRHAELAFTTGFDQIWRAWKFPSGEMVDRPPWWRSAAAGWMKDGITLDEVAEYVRVSMLNPTVDDAAKFAYLVGCCRNNSRKRHEEVEAIYRAETVHRQFNEITSYHSHAATADPGCACCGGTGAVPDVAGWGECWCLTEYDIDREVR